MRSGRGRPERVRIALALIAVLLVLQGGPGDDARKERTTTGTLSAGGRLQGGPGDDARKEGMTPVSKYMLPTLQGGPGDDARKEEKRWSDEPRLEIASMRSGRGRPEREG